MSRTTSLSVGVSESQPLSARRWAARLPRRSPHDADREINRWLGPLFVLMIFGFTSIAVVNTLAMIALRRRRELGLLGLVGATRRQVRSMARWEAVLIVAIGLGLGLAIAATALLPLSHALTGSLRPYVPIGKLAAILGVSALLALVALAVRRGRRCARVPWRRSGSGNDALRCDGGRCPRCSISAAPGAIAAD